MNNELSIFEGKEIRRIEHNGRWWFVIVDVISVLTDSVNPEGYLKDMRRRDPELSKGGGQFATPLPIPTAGGVQMINCADTEGILRIMQSIPSPKAEPFKRWLAKLGYERVQEIQDPELATKRTWELYKSKGYSDGWIQKRLRGIAVRDELTGEWQERGIQEGLEYSILTAEISKAAFGMTPKQYREYKSLQKENLRDHMTDLELIFSMLGEASTTEITRAQDAQGLRQAKTAARQGGNVAGNARKELEQKSKQKVITPNNYLLNHDALEDGAIDDAT